MKNLLKIAAVAGLAFTMASCGTANDAYGNNYPNRYPAGNGGVFRTPDGGTYRTGEIYRDRNGNVYENGRVVRTGDVYGRPGILGRDNTVYNPNTNARRLPPGQAKKIYGGSAKDYAPGQVKKRHVQRAEVYPKYKKEKHDPRKAAGKYKNSKNGKGYGKNK